MTKVTFKWRAPSTGEDQTTVRMDSSSGRRNWEEQRRHEVEECLGTRGTASVQLARAESVKSRAFQVILSILTLS